jgi:hypothetical protein
MGDNNEYGIIIVCVLLCTVFIFWAIRAVLLWYWRVNDIVAQLEQTNTHLKRLVELNSPAVTPVEAEQNKN